MLLLCLFDTRRALALTRLCWRRRIGCLLCTGNVGSLRGGLLLRTRRANFYLGGDAARTLATSEDRGERARLCASTTVGKKTPPSNTRHVPSTKGSCPRQAPDP